MGTPESALLDDILIGIRPAWTAFSRLDLMTWTETDKQVVLWWLTGLNKNDTIPTRTCTELIEFCKQKWISNGRPRLVTLAEARAAQSLSTEE